MKIAIIGAGKMGSWLARMLSSGNEVAVYDRDAARAQVCAGAGKITALPALSGLSGFRPQMLINAASIQNTVAAFGEARPFLGDDCIICDVASIKSGLEEYYSECGLRFASVHPMFGPTFAEMDALREENAIIISSSDPEGKAFFTSFFGSLGVRIFEYSFAEHDRMMAYSLTTPFVASLVFAACMDGAAVPGSTFARHRKIAKGLLSEDDSLLSEILFNPHSLSQLDKITSRLEFLKHIIKARDSEEMTDFLAKLRKNIG
ncbi:MAG: prephenate dehydrogenase/arogenate dehydrogenase family protein [Candidatus Micrarchaeota archaeon]